MRGSGRAALAMAIGRAMTFTPGSYRGGTAYMAEIGQQLPQVEAQQTLGCS